ncbi:MAG: hypothetical protein ACKO96_31715, partial [Flammeovirgaceae bacterium]
MGAILPVYFSLIVDETLMLLQIIFIVIEKYIHVIVLKHKAELNRQKVITNKCHQQNEVIYNILNSTIFNLSNLLSKLAFE